MIDRLIQSMEDLENGKNVFKEIQKEEEILRELKFLSAFHELKIKLISLNNNKEHNIYSFTLYLNKEHKADSYLVMVPFLNENVNSIGNLAKKDKDEMIEFIESIIYPLASNLYFNSETAFGKKVTEGALVVTLNELIDNLEDILLNDKLKSYYSAANLSRKLNNTEQVSNHKMKI